MQLLDAQWLCGRYAFFPTALPRLGALYLRLEWVAAIAEGRGVPDKPESWTEPI